MSDITRYVEDLLGSRRPRSFSADEDDAALARIAITLRSARPECAAPTEEFVTGLHKRLAAELDVPAPQAGPAPVSRRPRRRSFVRAASVAAGAAAIGAGLDHLLRPARAAAPPAAAGVIQPDHGTWQVVLASADVPEGTVRPFELGTMMGFVERAQGRLRAVSGVCTHQGCRLVLADDDSEFMCPCHGATFALDGSVLRHRLRFQLTALPRMAVREAGGSIQVFAPRS